MLWFCCSSHRANFRPFFENIALHGQLLPKPRVIVAVFAHPWHCRVPASVDRSIVIIVACMMFACFCLHVTALPGPRGLDFHCFLSCVWAAGQWVTRSGCWSCLFYMFWGMSFIMSGCTDVQNGAVTFTIHVRSFWDWVLVYVSKIQCHMCYVVELVATMCTVNSVHDVVELIATTKSCVKCPFAIGWGLFLFCLASWPMWLSMSPPRC